VLKNAKVLPASTTTGMEETVGSASGVVAMEATADATTVATARIIVVSTTTGMEDGAGCASGVSALEITADTTTADTARILVVSTTTGMEDAAGSASGVAALETVAIAAAADTARCFAATIDPARCLPKLLPVGLVLGITCHLFGSSAPCFACDTPDMTTLIPMHFIFFMSYRVQYFSVCYTQKVFAEKLKIKGIYTSHEPV